MKYPLPLSRRPAFRSFVWLALPVLLLSLGSCKKALELITFQISDSSTVTVPPAPLGSYMLPGIAVTSTSTNTYQVNNTNADYVQDVTLDQLTLSIEAPAGQNFNFLQSISISIASDAAGSDKVLIASLSSVPQGVTTINLTPTDSKLDKFLRNGSYSLITSAALKQSVTQPIRLRTDARYNVRARQP
ncbi:hypothetical protein [uncultured Hymenobacter sp.]|uniref:hypothetical protein n=1 Tax=uncultured Hymenobacter sp. TaxID=170016 RepID=UPI0035C9E832